MHNMGQQVHTYDLPLGNMKITVRINNFSYVDTIKTFLANICNDYTNYEQGVLVRRNDPTTILEKENIAYKKQKMLDHSRKKEEIDKKVQDACNTLPGWRP